MRGFVLRNTCEIRTLYASVKSRIGVEFPFSESHVTPPRDNRSMQYGDFNAPYLSTDYLGGNTLARPHRQSLTYSTLSSWKLLGMPRQRVARARSA